MPKIIKYYIDIGCVYECDGTAIDAYKSLQCWNTKKYGVIGVLKLSLDPEKRTKEEIFFKQIFSPYVNKFANDIIKDISRGAIKEFREYQDEDMIVTWNGRDFDLPIIINNISISKEYRKYYLDSVSKKDRDLLDICILREIDVKGGLQKVVKKLQINHTLGNKFSPTYGDNEEHFLTALYVGTNKYNNYIKLAKHRNEFDVRMLPLLEERLGFLYEPRSYIDRYHKKWV